MLRLIFFLIQLALVVVAALWLTANTQDMSMVVMGTRITMNAGLAALMLLIVVWILFQVFRLIKAFVDLPANQRKQREENKHRRGLDAISKGLSALAAGDSKEAAKQSKVAQKYLAKSPLTHLISAQTALLEGNSDKADENFIAMLEDQQAAFMGLRGLITQAMKRGDRAETVALLYEALKLRPKTFWVVDTLFRLEAAQGHWADTLTIIDQGRSNRVLAKPQAQRYLAVVQTQIAREHLTAGELKEARTAAQRAVQLAPDLAPAQLVLADLLRQSDGPEAAAKALQRAWKRQPHALYSYAYLQALGAEGPRAILDAMTALHDLRSDHALSKLELGRAQLAAGELEAARESLAPLENRAPSHRLFRALASLEEAEGGSLEAINALQAKASLYARDDAWSCSACQDEHQAWNAVCPTCESFDTLSWESEQIDRDNRPALEQRLAGSVALLEAGR